MSRLQWTASLGAKDAASAIMAILKQRSNCCVDANQSVAAALKKLSQKNSRVDGNGRLVV